LNLPEDTKLEILMAQLQERYNALHKMRDRSMQFVLWILGFALGIAWLLIREVTLNVWQKWAVFVLVIIIGIISFIFVRAIAQGFCKNRRIIISIESLLGLHETGFYGTSVSILPKSYSKDRPRCTDHFSTLYLLMAVIFGLLILLTFVNPSKSKSVHSFLSDDLR